MKHTFFITGIGTDVGKTVISAIVTEALKADYWKPVQAGDLHNTDTHKVVKLLSNNTSVLHSSAYELHTPMSPHAAAAIDGVSISWNQIKRPKTRNNLVIEGAGGLLVPINQNETIADYIDPKDKVILVSRHYLGSINHTLLSLEFLKQRGLNVFGIIFSGAQHPTTESIITQMGQAPIIGRVDEEPYFDKNVVREYADIFSEKIKSLFETK